MSLDRIYEQPGPPNEVDVAALAALLASLPPDAIISHRTAAQIWGLWIPQFDGIDVTTPAGWRGSRYTTSVQRIALTAHRRKTDAHDITDRFGLPVTTLSRTWLDLAATLDVHDLVAAGDSALRAGCRPVELVARVAQTRRLRGVVNARVAVELLDERSRSRPESRVRSALVQAGLPYPRVNEPVFEHGWLGEPDLHYPEARLAIEYNGADHADVPRMRKDATRLLDFQRAGWEVRTYTAVDAFQRLDDVVADVRELLRRRAPQLLTAAELSRRVTYLHDQRRRNRRL